MKDDFVKTDYVGRVVQVLGMRDSNSSTSTPADEIELRPGLGIVGDKNNGPTRSLKPRREWLLSKELDLPAGTEMANMREISVVSREELEIIRQAMAVSDVPLGALGENITVSGIDDLTSLMVPGTVLVFQREGDAPVVVSIWGRNPSCETPGTAIQACNLGQQPSENFQKASHGVRGGVGQVVVGGLVRPGDTMTIRHPRIH